MEVLLDKPYIKDLLEKKNLTKAQFAVGMGIKRQNVDALLASKKKDINTVLKMAEVLGMSLDELLGIKTKEDEVYGCLYIEGEPHIVNSKQEILELLNQK